MDKISIVVPVYNVAPYLDKCLQSIMAQTYSNLEVICVDDGSTDGSGEILERYAKEDARFKVFHQENVGIAATRNVALRYATGAYVGFVDSDDWIEPEMYELLYNKLQQTQADIAICGYFIDSEIKNVVAQNQKSVPEGKIVAKDFLRYMYERDVYKGVASYVWNRLFRMELFSENQEHGWLAFNQCLETCEDIYFVAQCHVRAKSSIYVSNPLYHYAQRLTSIMHQPEFGLKTLSTCRAYDMMIDLFERNQVAKQVIDLLKRFYVYHASLMLKTAYRINDIEKIGVLKGMVWKYLGVYIKTNLGHPKRIVEVLGLLLRGTEK